MKMISLQSPRTKLLAAGACLLALVGAPLADAFSATVAARVVLTAVALAGLVFWLWRRRDSSVPRLFRETPRLEVLQRLGLSPRTALALVEIDGHPYVIVHGEGFARIRPTKRPSKAIGS